MIGSETVVMLENRAQAIETQMDRAPAAQLLPEARQQLEAANAELARDRAEHESAQQRYSAKHWGLSRYVPRTAAQGFATAELAPREAEIAGDRAAIARLSATVRTLNQRVDGGSYQAVVDRMEALQRQKKPIITGDDAALLASVSNDWVATDHYLQYSGGRYVQHSQAVTLAAATADRTPDIGAVLADYRNLRRRDGMVPQTAALLATTGDVEGSYKRFTTLRGQRLGDATASLLAVSASANARPIFDAVRKAGAPDWYAAVLAGAAADAGATPAQAVQALTTVNSSQRGAASAALLAAASFASGRTLDQMDAAYAHFAQRRSVNATALAASWALAGRGSVTMGAISTALTLQRQSDDDAALAAAQSAATSAAIAASVAAY